jgi:hypothetical protein
MLDLQRHLGRAVGAYFPFAIEHGALPHAGIKWAFGPYLQTSTLRLKVWREKNRGILQIRG